ncbi:MAG: hypothetical protein JXP34_01105 [Planctomycetes bacterium]|nr:hypothetical protein [Planctomycetota bacterium]
MQGERGYPVYIARAAGIVAFLCVTAGTLVTHFAIEGLRDLLLRKGDVSLPRITELVLHHRKAVWGIPWICLASFLFAWSPRSRVRILVHLLICCAAMLFLLSSWFVVWAFIVRLEG